jgi:hypothetical protein
MSQQGFTIREKHWQRLAFTIVSTEVSSMSILHLFDHEDHVKRTHGIEF